VLVACVLLSGTWASAQEDKDKEPTLPAAPAAKNPKELDQAVELFKKRDYDGCERLLKEVVREHKDMSPASILMVRLFAQMQSEGGMRAYLEKAVKEEPKDPEAFVILGSMAQDNRRFTEADLLFTKAGELLAKSPIDAKRKQAMEPQALSGQAWVAEAREDWPKAQQYLDLLLKALDALPPPDGADAKKARAAVTADAMGRLARVLFQEGDAVASLKELKLAKQTDLETVLTPEARLAEFYEQMGGPKNHKEAERWMKAALAKAPDDLRTRLAAAHWAVNTGDIDMAKVNAEKALEVDKNSLDAKAACGVVALFQKDFPAAENYFESALMQRPSAWVAKNDLALALCEQSDEQKKQRALEYADDNARNPQLQKRPEVWSTYAWVLYKADKKPQAFQAMSKCLELYGNILSSLSPDTAYYFAQICYDVGRKDDARLLINQSLKDKDRPFSTRTDAQKLKDKLDREAAAEKSAK
jgi:Tfp pilus assembly protein PilF